MFVIRSITEFRRDQILEIFALADFRNELFQVHADAGRGRILGTLFFQPSTRTRLSFQSAFLRIGGNIIGFSNIEESRGGSSGESLSDTAHVVSKYCDVMVVRTPFNKQFEDFVSGASVPVLSGGHGHQEHPTQGLLDIYTIWRVCKQISGLRILVVANLPKRTVNSFLLGLSFWNDVQVAIVSPSGQHLDHRFQSANPPAFDRLEFFHSFQSFRQSSWNLKEIDLIYLEETAADYEGTNPLDFVLDKRILQLFRRDVYINHSLPRLRMIPANIDDTRNALYFENVLNGLYLRAALFSFLLSSGEL